MKEKPQCAIEDCERPGWILFSGQWVCGECLNSYNKKMERKIFNRMEDVLLL